ncbi:hypothetical protein HYW74_03630 [Candidatus Pacearchaeota archaeon]|nr:hypothetical protein [Candidatus Pacearchaeota archaeon]
MDQVKEAFQKVKEDITLLKQEISNINKELGEIQNSILALFSVKNNYNISEKNHDFRQTDQQTLRQINQTHSGNSTDTSTDKYHFQGLKSQNTLNSIGNKGVSTDRQTNQQTDRHIYSSNPSLILSQLDALKKETILQFKHLTNQEMLVFSFIYQLEDQGFLVDYHLLSSHLNLSESSIRDYIQRIIAKGVPLEKEKVNNKKVLLHISQDLKKLASLDTLIKLREI